MRIKNITSIIETQVLEDNGCHCSLVPEGPNSFQDLLKGNYRIFSSDFRMMSFPELIDFMHKIYVKRDQIKYNQETDISPQSQVSDTILHKNVTGNTLTLFTEDGIYAKDNRYTKLKMMDQVGFWGNNPGVEDRKDLLKEILLDINDRPSRKNSRFISFEEFSYGQMSFEDIAKHPLAIFLAGNSENAKKLQEVYRTINRDNIGMFLRGITREEIKDHKFSPFLSVPYLDFDRNELTIRPNINPESKHNLYSFGIEKRKLPA